MKKHHLHILIGLFLMFIFGHIVPPLYPITPLGMEIVGVFLGLIWLWCFVGFLWPSLLGFAAFALTDFATMGQIVSMAFGNNVVVLLLFSMILFGSPQHVGATKYITRWFLTRKIFNNRPIVFSFVFILATYALSLAVNVTPALVLMWSVLYGILKDLNYEKGEKFTSLMVVGTFLGAISGQATLPFSGSTLAILGTFTAASHLEIPVLPYMFMGLIMSLTVFIGYALFMKVVCKSHDLHKIAHVNSEMFNKEPLAPMNLLQKANFLSMLAFVVLMLLPSFLPDTFLLTHLLDSLGTTGIAILLTGFMSLVKVQGEPLLDFSAVAAKSVNWDIWVMVAIALAVSGALIHESTGVVEWMLVAFEPLLGGHSPLMFFVIMLLFGIVSTSFASAMVLSISLMPVLVVFGEQAGANLPAVTTVFVLLVHYSIILPSASVFAAMLWANGEWISGKDVFKYGLAIVVIATVVALGLMLPLSLVVF